MRKFFIVMSMLLFMLILIGTAYAEMRLIPAGISRPPWKVIAFCIMKSGFGGRQ